MPLRWRAGGLLARRQVQPLHKGATDHLGAGGQIGLNAAAIVDGFDQFAREAKCKRFCVFFWRSHSNIAIIMLTL